MRERLGSVDSAWFHMDRPENTADVVACLTFRRLPAAATLRRIVEERVLAHARFRQRVVRGPGDIAWWEDDPAFDLERHLRFRPLGRGRHALERLVGEVASEQLDPAHPLWKLEMVEGPGTAALVAKLHHCLADGFALVSLFLSLADERADEPAPRHVLAAYRRVAPWLAPREELGPALRDPRRALGLGLQALGMGAALARIVALRADPPTALARPLTGVRRVAWSGGFPLARLRRAALAHRATLNDLLMAALAGALRQTLAAGGAAPSLRALVPVNLRPGMPDPGLLGNRFGLVFLDLPLAVPSPEARLAAVQAGMQRLKDRPDALVTFGLLAAVGALPPIEPAAVSFFARKASLVVTNVPGPRTHLHLGGRRIERALFWVPHPVSLGVGASILSYAGDVRLGVRADVGVLPDPAALVRHFEGEVAALGGGRPRSEGRRARPRAGPAGSEPRPLASAAAPG